MHALYIDDLSEAEAIDLKKCLVKDPVQRHYPLNFHERTQHILPVDKSSLQKQLQTVEDFTDKNLMKINESKSKIMIFNKSRKYDFPLLSKPKLNHRLNSTEFEVRLHSYREVHHPPPTATTQTQLVYSKLGRADNCPASKKGPSVQVYSHTQTSEATLYYVFAAEL